MAYPTDEQIEAWRGRDVPEEENNALAVAGGEAGLALGASTACLELVQAGSALWAHPSAPSIASDPGGGRGSGWLPQGSVTWSRTAGYSVPLSQAGVMSACSSPASATEPASTVSSPPHAELYDPVLLCVLGSWGQGQSLPQTPILNVGAWDGHQRGDSRALLLQRRGGGRWGKQWSVCSQAAMSGSGQGRPRCAVGSFRVTLDLPTCSGSHWPGNTTESQLWMWVSRAQTAGPGL